MAICLEKTKNALVEQHYNAAMNEFAKYHTVFSKFRHCLADYCYTENYIILRSYSTIVAVIDKNQNVCYDALRWVYGYTATSSQHIRKFCHDFATTRIAWR